MRIRGLEMLVFRKILRTHLVDGPLVTYQIVMISLLCFWEPHLIKLSEGTLYLRYKVKIMNITLSCAIWKIITTLTDLISFCVATDSIWEHTKKEKLKLVHWFWKWPVFTHISSVIRRKSESQNGCLRKETAPNFQKNQHFYLLIRTRRCAYHT